MQKLNVRSIKPSSQSLIYVHWEVWEKELGSISACTGIYTHCGSTLLLTQIILIEIIIAYFTFFHTHNKKISYTRKK